ncbi:MAG: hypothetical protein WA432_01270 [Candidatus Babeliaceae bacterium]
MQAKNFNFPFIFIMTFMLGWYLPVSPAVALGTKIGTPNGLVPIEQLSVGDLIISYNPADNSFPIVKIKHISSYRLESGLVIQTDQGSIGTSPDQFFYDYAQNDFIRAKDLHKGQSFLSSRNFEQYECLDINVIDQSMIYYELTVDEPHLFFSSDAQVLAHNFVAAAPLVYPITQWVLGAAVASVSLYGIQKIFTNLEEGKNYIINQMQLFSNQFSIKSYSNKNISYTANPPLIAEIQPNPQVYREIMVSPFLHGPMCITAQITDNGDIECILNVWYFNYYDNTHKRNIFSWKELGRKTFDYDYSLVKTFIEEENKKQLDNLRTVIKTWPQSLIKKLSKCNFDIKAINQLSGHGSLKQIIYGITFDVYAMYQMVSKNIPPLLVRYVLKCGKYIPSCWPNCSICFDTQHTIAVVIEKKSKKVISVVLYNEINELQPEESVTKGEGAPPKTVEDILKGAKQGRKTKGKTKQFEKPGGYKEALEDFESLAPKDVKNIPTGKVGVLPDGRRVNVRTQSDEGRPTLEIQDGNSDKKIKIRYG